MAQIRQHLNARLTPYQRRAMVELMLGEGWSVAAAAERFQVSAKTARKWRDRYLAEGPGGLLDRSSRPHHCPARTPAAIRRRVCELHPQTPSPVGVGLAVVDAVLLGHGTGCGVAGSSIPTTALRVGAVGQSVPPNCSSPSARCGVELLLRGPRQWG